MTELQRRQPSRIQTVVLSKDRFRTRQAATKWARDHDFRTDKVDETDTGFRFRQIQPATCIEGSFRTIRIDTGVSAVVCRPRNVRAADRRRPGRRPGQVSAGRWIEIDDFDQAKYDRLDAELEGGVHDLCVLAMPAEIIEMRVGTSKLSDTDRRDLLSSSRQGGVVELDLDVVSFQQPRKPSPLPSSLRRLANRNFVTFREKDLPAFASSFAGKPFLRDHDRRDLLARGGTVRRSELKSTAERFKLVQGVQLVKPWAVESALDGTLETFSIGWEPMGGGGFAALRNSIFCTVCQKRLFSHDCSHMPGQVVKVANEKQSVIVEAEFRDPRGVEVSGVAFPAVKGTHVESIKPA